MGNNEASDRQVASEHAEIMAQSSMKLKSRCFNRLHSVSIARLGLRQLRSEKAHIAAQLKNGIRALEDPTSPKPPLTRRP
jgi:hypothetical protein